MTIPDWPELDPWGGIVRGTTFGTDLRVTMPVALGQWLRAAGRANSLSGIGQAGIVRLALARYLAVEYPALRPEVACD